jgi:hypothetical protein
MLRTCIRWGGLEALGVSHAYYSTLHNTLWSFRLQSHIASFYVTVAFCQVHYAQIFPSCSPYSLTPPNANMLTGYHNFVRPASSTLLRSTIYPLATGFQPWLAACGIGNGGFFRFCVKKTGCRIALS